MPLRHCNRSEKGRMQLQATPSQPHAAHRLRRMATHQLTHVPGPFLAPLVANSPDLAVLSPRGSRSCDTMVVGGGGCHADAGCAVSSPLLAPLQVASSSEEAPWWWQRQRACSSSGY